MAQACPVILHYQGLLATLVLLHGGRRSFMEPEQVRKAFSGIFPPGNTQETNPNKRQRRPSGMDPPSSNSSDTSSLVRMLCQLTLDTKMRWMPALLPTPGCCSWAPERTAWSRLWSADRSSGIRGHSIRKPPILIINRSGRHCGWMQSRLSSQSSNNSRMPRKVHHSSIEAGLLSSDMCFQPLKWNPNQKRLCPIESSTKTTLAEMDEMLNNLHSLSLDNNMILRFHCLKNPDNPKGTLPWKLQINPVKGEQMIRYMEKLSQSSLWLLIQGRLRPCSMQRSGLAQEIQRQLKKWLTAVGRYVLDSLLSVRFDNPSNFCFANAACSALMWSTACLSNFSWTQWGIGYDTFCEIMVRGLQHPVCPDGFFNIVAKYGTEFGSLPQQDAAEFTGDLLGWCRLQPVNMTWERRYEHDGRIRIEESGSAYEPVGVGLKKQLSLHIHPCNFSFMGAHTWHG